MNAIKKSTAVFHMQITECVKIRLVLTLVHAKLVSVEMELC